MKKIQPQKASSPSSQVKDTKDTKSPETPTTSTTRRTMSKSKHKIQTPKQPLLNRSAERSSKGG